MAITKTSNSGLSGTKYNDIAADNNYMETIGSTLLSSNTATISFNNIPQEYKHLQIRLIAKGTATTGMFNYRVNGDTGSNYSIHSINANGASVGSNNAPDVQYIRAMRSDGISSTADIFTASIVDILDYQNTNKYKTFRMLSGADKNGSGGIEFESGLWMNTAPIRTIEIFCSSNFNQYSRFSLYGIKG